MALLRALSRCDVGKPPTVMFPVTTFRECLQEERTALRERWSDVARAAALAARRARAGTHKVLSDLKKKSQQKKATAPKKKGGGKAVDPEKEKERAAKKAETDAKRASAEQRRATAAKYDGQLKSAAKELAAMAAQSGKGTAAYRQKYAAYKALQDAKREALGGAPRVEAPESEKKKAAPKGRTTSSKKSRVPATRNRFKRAGEWRKVT